MAAGVVVDGPEQTKSKVKNFLYEFLRLLKILRMLFTDQKIISIGNVSKSSFQVLSIPDVVVVVGPEVVVVVDPDVVDVDEVEDVEIVGVVVVEAVEVVVLESNFVRKYKLSNTEN